MDDIVPEIHLHLIGFTCVQKFKSDQCYTVKSGTFLKQKKDLEVKGIRIAHAKLNQ